MHQKQHIVIAPCSLREICNNNPSGISFTTTLHGSNQVSSVPPPSILGTFTQPTTTIFPLRISSSVHPRVYRTRHAECDSGVKNAQEIFRFVKSYTGRPAPSFLTDDVFGVCQLDGQAAITTPSELSAWPSKQGFLLQSHITMSTVVPFQAAMLNNALYPIVPSDNGGSTGSNQPTASTGGIGKKSSTGGAGDTNLGSTGDDLDPDCLLECAGTFSMPSIVTVAITIVAMVMRL